MHFSYDLEESLTEAERAADAKLQQMGYEIDNAEDGHKTIMNFFKLKETMENS